MKKPNVIKRVMPVIASAIMASALYTSYSFAGTNNIPYSDIMLGDTLEVGAGYYEDSTVINIPTKQQVIERHEINIDDLVQYDDTLEGISRLTASYYNGGNNDTLGVGLSSSSGNKSVSLSATGASTLNLGVNESITLPTGYYAHDVNIKNGVANLGTLNWKPTTSTTKTIPAGYYTGGTLDSSGAYNTGYNKGKTDGLASTTGTATASQILNGYTAWVNGSKVTGTMANKGPLNWKPTTGTTLTVAAGYYSGGTLDSRDVYNAGYDKGKSEGLSSTTGTATASQILSGYTAWVNGKKITGTMANRGGYVDVRGSQQGRYDAGGYYYVNGLPAGYYSEHEIRIPISQKGDTQLYKDGYSDGRIQGQNDAKANPGAYGLEGQGSHDQGVNEGKQAVVNDIKGQGKETLLREVPCSGSGQDANVWDSYSGTGVRSWAVTCPACGRQFNVHDPDEFHGVPGHNVTTPVEAYVVTDDFLNRY